MYKFSKSDDPNQILGNSTNTNFIELLKGKWDHIHDETNVFRYKVSNMEEKVVDNLYLLQLNPDRATKRRVPEQVDNICEPFDPKKFNFNLIDEKEKLFNISKSDSNVHVLLVNVSPISRYHSLLCPFLTKNLPQIATEESLIVALDMMFYANHRDLRIGFNSLCALASVNHLHYHLFLEPHTLPVENAKCKRLKGPLFYLLDYPVPAFCFQIKTRVSVSHMSRQISVILSYFLAKSIAHNIFITRGADFVANEDEGGKSKSNKSEQSEVIRILIWPRKSSTGVKQSTAFNIAVLELSGWFPIYDKVDFDRLTRESLENELKKWAIDNFESLKTEVMDLF